jgi:hypothetical protein
MDNSLALNAESARNRPRETGSQNRDIRRGGGGTEPDGRAHLIGKPLPRQRGFPVACRGDEKDYSSAGLVEELRQAWALHDMRRDRRRLF